MKPLTIAAMMMACTAQSKQPAQQSQQPNNKPLAPPATLATITPPAMAFETKETMKTDTTPEQVARLLAGGMRQITPRQLRAEVERLGYEIDLRRCFSYINSANEIAYKARSISYRHKASGKGYAHVEAPRETLPELQEIRRNCFVLNNGRIWEL